MAPEDNRLTTQIIVLCETRKGRGESEPCFSYLEFNADNLPTNIPNTAHSPPGAMRMPARIRPIADMNKRRSRVIDFLFFRSRIPESAISPIVLLHKKRFGSDDREGLAFSRTRNAFVRLPLGTCQREAWVRVFEMGILHKSLIQFSPVFSDALHLITMVIKLFAMIMI